MFFKYMPVIGGMAATILFTLAAITGCDELAILATLPSLVALLSASPFKE